MTTNTTIEYYNASNFMKLTEQEAAKVRYVLVVDTSKRYWTYDVVVNDIDKPADKVYTVIHDLSYGEICECSESEMSSTSDYLVRKFINDRLAECYIVKAKE